MNYNGKDINVETKIRFGADKQFYKVKACNNRFAICTRPYNPKHTVYYTIIDLAMLIRGTNNLIFNSYDYTDQKDIDLCLKELMKGKVEISHRNNVQLDISEIKN